MAAPPQSSDSDDGSQPIAFSQKGPRPKAVIIGVPDRQRVQREAARLLPIIALYCDIIAEDYLFEYQFTDPEIDLVIVLGGDGSILQTARQLAGREIPVLGINCGSLGFLAAISPDEFLEVWPHVCSGNYEVIDHLMLEVQLIRNNEVISQQLVLNEVAVLGGPPYQIMGIDLYADGTLATRYQCDGLILATPVGSTAHNLSAGGPILRRRIQAVVISPISPHTLTYRPLVDSAETRFELTVTDPGESTSVVVDGRILGQLLPGDRVLVHRAASNFQMIAVPGQNDYHTLREKLGWGGSL